METAPSMTDREIQIKLAPTLPTVEGNSNMETLEIID